MEFETLKYFFNNELSVKINVTKKVKSEYIRIHSIDVNNDIIFYDLDEENEDSYQRGTVSKNDAIKLKNATDKSFDYFAKVIDSNEKSFTVSIINFKKLPLDGDVSIGIGDAGAPYKDIVNHIEKEYFLDICGKKYYVYGNHINAGLNMFSIMSASMKYDVILSRREECGAVLEKDTANEQIWAIRKKESSYKKDDYTFQLRLLNISFSDISSAAAATEQNKLEMKNFNENGILGRWIKFTEEDFNISKEKIELVGLLKFNNYDHVDGNIHIFTINSEKEKLDIFKKFKNELGSDLTLEIYNNLDEATQEKVRRKIAKVKLLDVVGDKLKCFYDEDVIIKNEGYIKISNKGSEVIHDRRMDAVNRIMLDGAAKPNIMSLIEGKPIYTSNNKKVYNINDFMKEIKNAFGGRMPNKSQLDAIEMAINTPDFLVIQGPPGCGKTSLVNAIDDCLAKIDSTFHRKAASLSTAYQRESTKNMVAKKCINGVPVPFISKSSDKVFIESNFQEYIENIANKLKNKYPNLVEKMNKKTNVDTLTSYVSRFNVETATYESLLFFLDNILECIKDTVLFEQKQELEDIQKIAQKKLKRILEPKKDESLYFIRIIPSSQVELEDEGLKTFMVAKINLKVLNPSFENYLDKIESILESATIDFNLINALKNEMIFKIKNSKQLDKDIKLNEKAKNIVYEIKTIFEEEATHDNDSLIVQYIDSFINNPVRVRQALEQWITSVAATHQISSDSAAINQSKDEEDNSYVVYNNVLVDEAARSCPPDLLIPIACAKNRIIMVGDHKQLPQFVNDEVLERLDLDESIKKDMKNISMFEYLIETTKKLEKNDSFPRFIALNQQYRMPKILGDFIGENFYPEIGLGSPRGNPCDDENFVQTLPYISNKCMVWCDVPYGKETSVAGKGQKNVEEAIVVSKMLNSFLNDEKNSNLKIGVISFYKDQVKEIINQLVSYNIFVKDEAVIKINDSFKNRLQVDTVDAFQGLECDIIILSMVRSNPYKKFKPGSFGFLKDEHHLCVALSRQKRCLVVVGNGSGMLETDVAESSVKALVNYYKHCKKGGEYIGFIESKDII